MLYVHTADRVDLLVGRLAEVMAEPPDDPFAPEWLATPTDGLRRWVSLELARHLGAAPGRADGVAANIIRAYPDALRRAVLAADPEGPPDGDDPWQVDRLVWAVLAVLDDVRSGGDPSPVGHGMPVPTYGTARGVADLFDRYHLHRPAMVRRWAAGSDVDGTGRPLDPEDAWQPVLWRAVRRRAVGASPPERMPRLLGDLTAGRLELDLPGRLVFFGFSALPAGDFLGLVRAVAGLRDVHLLVPDPALYDRAELVARRAAGPEGSVGLRVDDRTPTLAHHPLVRSWGRLHRESAAVLAAAAGPDIERVSLGSSDDGAPPSTMLARLQQAIRSNRPPAEVFVPDPEDHSVRFHACFGRIRQVEVARDVILHELADHEGSLSEDDVLVVCPSIERFAPLVEAVFGPPALTDDVPVPSRGGTPALRYRIADRALGSTNPLLSAMSALLELVVGRFDPASVLDFLALAPVRHRFGFDEEALSRVADWVEETNVRVGLDGDQRSTLGLPATVTGNTWAAALDRLLVGVAVEDRTPGLAVGDVVPFGVEGSDVDLVGRLAECTGALGDIARLVGAHLTLGEWIVRLREGAHRLFALPPDATYASEQFERLMGEIATAAGSEADGSPVPLTFTEVRRVVEERFATASGRADFFRGGVTVTSMRPLRWVPFRVVVLLGMDEGALPSDQTAGDDLVARHPYVGDRDARADGREALLETVLSATEHLVVVREGHDVRTNQPVPMTVPVAELHDAILADVDPARRDDVRGQLEIHHPRHGFDERCFLPGALGVDGPWGFDGDDLAGARARRTSGPPTTVPFVAAPLSHPEQDVIELDDLRRFFANPAKAFLNGRLGAAMAERDDVPQPVVPTDLSGLARWQVADRLLRDRMAGVPADTWRRVEAQLGTLPPAPLDVGAVADVEADVEAVIARAGAAGVMIGAPEPVPVDARLPGGLRVVGTVPCLTVGDRRGPVRLQVSKYAPRRRLDVWLDLMALMVNEPEGRWTSVLVNTDGDGGTVLTHLVVPEAGADRVDPTEALGTAIDCYRRGQCEPIPLFPKLSPAIMKGGRPYSGDWHNPRFYGDGDDAAVVLAFGRADYETIMTLPPRDDDPDRGRDRTSRFATYLHRALVRSIDELGDPKGADGRPQRPRPAKGTARSAATTPASGDRSS